MSVDTEKKHYKCKKCGGLLSYSDHGRKATRERHCSNGGLCDWKVVQQSYNNSLLGGAINLVGKGVKAGVNAGVNAAEEYNSEEAKQARELKRQEQEEKRKIAEAEEKRKAGVRREKADKLREEGKPLTAFLVQTNPTYLMLVGAIIVFALIIGGKKYGVFFVGGIITITVAFIGFVIKDFFKLESKKGLIITSILIALSIGGTVGTYYYKQSKGGISPELEAKLNQATTELNNQQNQVNQVTTKEGSNNAVEKSEQPIATTSENISDDFIGNWSGDFGKDKLTIRIESIDESGNVNGFDEVKGNRRTLTGTKTENTFTLNEPGDDKWDGVFTFEFNQTSKTFIGEWKSNNGKSTKQFTLNKN